MSAEFIGIDAVVLTWIPPELQISCSGQYHASIAACNLMHALFSRRLQSLFIICNVGQMLDRLYASAAKVPKAAKPHIFI